jgi:hypothetical protein
LAKTSERHAIDGARYGPWDHRHLRVGMWPIYRTGEEG